MTVKYISVSNIIIKVIIELKIESIYMKEKTNLSCRQIITPTGN